MSVGQIYRYFPSKEAIVHAIVERIVAKRLQWMLNRDKQVNFAAVLAQREPFRPSDEDEHSDRILMLEITAEATRNAAVARDRARGRSAHSLASGRAGARRLSGADRTGGGGPR